MAKKTLSLASWRALPQLSALLQGRAPVRPDWKAILDLANRRLVTPRLHRSFQAPGLAGAVPEEVAAFVAEIHEANRARNGSLHGTLGDVLAALNAAGIEPVLLKGAALWALAGDPAPSGDRILSDVDVLVAPGELDAAVRAMEAAGFVHYDLPTPEVVVLGRPVDAGVVDVHTRPPGPAAVYAPLGDIRAMCARTAIAGGAAWTPSPALQIFISAVHDHFHDGVYRYGGFNLTHLLDVRDLALRCGPDDWGRLLEYCHTARLRDGVGVQLLAARRLAGAAVPERLAAGLRPHVTFRRLMFQLAVPPLDFVIGALFLVKWKVARLLERTAGAPLSDTAVARSVADG